MMPNFDRTLFDAATQQHHLPQLSQSTQPVNPAIAYAAQQRLVKRLCESEVAWQIVGFKAALTAPAAQQGMGLNDPISGVLWQHGEHQTPATIQASPNRIKLLETEFGFYLNHALSQAVPDLASLKTQVAQVVPVIEVAHIPFPKPPSRGEDLIASNSASGEFILGEPYDGIPTQLDELTVTLEHNGEPIMSGVAGEVMQSQWLALLWLVNHITAQGYEILPQHLLMTGSVGGIVPARPGQYLASYSLGSDPQGRSIAFLML